jgi:hypothetical protein
VLLSYDLMRGGALVLQSPVEPSQDRFDERILIMQPLEVRGTEVMAESGVWHSLDVSAVA